MAFKPFQKMTAITDKVPVKTAKKKKPAMKLVKKTKGSSMKTSPNKKVNNFPMISGSDSDFA